MKLNTTIFLILLAICFSQISNSQEINQPCSCLLLEETEENDAKVIALGQYIETSLLNLSTEEFNEKFDIPSFINKIMSHNFIDKEDAFTQGFFKGMEGAGKKLSEQLVTSIEAGEYYNLINYKYDAEEMAYYFTFRLYSGETGVNYHDYKVCSNGESVKFNDIYIYLTGEPLTATLQRVFLLSQPNGENTSNSDKLKAKDNLTLLLESRKLDLQKNFEEAYNKISQITEPMANEKFILLIKATYASSFNDELYERALKDFADSYPDDPTLYLKSIDYNILKGNYNEAILNIDQLMAETDDDMLNLMKGNVYIEAKNYKKAETHYKYVTDNYPDLIDGYVGYIVSLNFQNRFEEIIPVIENLIEQEYDKNELLEFLEEKEPDGTNQLEAFVKSKVYKKWKRKS